MNKKFYYLLLKDNKKIGVLYAPCFPSWISVMAAVPVAGS